jgi:hypothetical protein
VRGDSTGDSQRGGFTSAHTVSLLSPPFSGVGKKHADDGDSRRHTHTHAGNGGFFLGGDAQCAGPHARASPSPPSYDVRERGGGGPLRAALGPPRRVLPSVRVALATHHLPGAAPCLCRVKEGTRAGCWVSDYLSGAAVNYPIPSLADPVSASFCLNSSQALERVHFVGSEGVAAEVATRGHAPSTPRVATRRHQRLREQHEDQWRRRPWW